MFSNLVALNLGSDKITAAISGDNSAEFEILDSVEVLSKGIENGIIKDKELAAECIKEALKKLSEKTSKSIKSVYISLGTKNSRIISNKGIYLSGNSDLGITSKEISKAYLNGKNVKINEDEYIADAIINEFYTEQEGYVENPLRIKSSSLEVDLDIVVSKKEIIEDIKEVFSGLGYEIKGFLLGIASLKKIFLDEKTVSKNLAIVEVGADKTEIAYFSKNRLKSLGYVPLGGRNITNDLSIAIEKDKEIAEKLKCEHSLSYITLRRDFSKIDADGNIIEADFFYDVVNARIEEILNYVKKELELSGIYDKIEDIIIFGDGITCFEDIQAYIESILEKNITIYTKDELNLENSSTLVSIAIVKEVYDRLKLLYKEENFSEKLFMEYNNNMKNNEIEDEKKTEVIKKEKKKGLSKVFGFLGDIF